MTGVGGPSATADEPRRLVPPRACFIVGMARSGTTLLRALLDSHPEVFALPAETFVAEWCVEDDPVAGLFRDRPFTRLFADGTEERAFVERRLREQLDGPTDVGTALRVLIEVLREQQPLPREPALFVEKTPRHLQHIAPLREAFGDDTRFVGLVRDPRDVLASINRFLGRDEQDDLRRFARQWATADQVLRAWSAALPGRVLALRYEDLVTDPEPSLRRITELLDLPWDDALLTPTRAVDTWKMEKRGSVPAAQVNTRSLHKYREGLREESVAHLERLLAPRMRAWGYAPEHGEFRWPSLKRWRLECRARRRAQGRLPG